MTVTIHAARVGRERENTYNTICDQPACLAIARQFAVASMWFRDAIRVVSIALRFDGTVMRS